MLSLVDKYYPIIYHVWSERYIYKNKGFPDLSKDEISNISVLFPFTLESIESLLGYKIEDYRPLFLTAMFTQKKRFREEMPDLYERIQTYLS